MRRLVRGVGEEKGLSHLPELKEIGFTASRRLLDVQRISHDPAEGAAVLAALTQPASARHDFSPGSPSGC